jgi:CHAD domain-containing protein
LLDNLVEACDGPEFSEAASAPADPIVLKLARKPWRRVQSAVSELPDEPRPEELHRLRILVKRARYAVEAVALIGGAAAEEFAFRLSELQDVLGEHQDAIVAGAWLRRRDPLQASAAGELIELEVARAGRAAEGWRALWNSADTPELTAWLGH